MDRSGREYPLFIEAFSLGRVWFSLIGFSFNGRREGRQTEGHWWEGNDREELALVRQFALMKVSVISLRMLSFQSVYCPSLATENGT